MRNILPSLACVAAIVAGLAIPVSADARVRDRSISVQGARGHGGVISRSVAQAPGSRSVAHSVQANNGRGATATRDRQWADGSFAGSKTLALNNGKSVDRTTTATATGDGTASYASTITGPNGGSRTVSGTASRASQ